MTEPRQPAILLLGPTGAGKSPLGQLIERRGLGDVRCLHFDFGESLRRIVGDRHADETFSPAEVEVLRQSLATGALLENEHFALAERIMRAFLTSRVTERRDCIVLNGLPRHVGQAQAIDAIVDVQAVVLLECSPETILQRLATDAGGDRAGRIDDDLPRVLRKLETYRERTAPLVNHYRRQDSRIDRISVEPTTSAAEMLATMERTRGRGSE